ncbi:hypothetical protein R6Q59_028203 [Mikania micrantha]
MMLQTQIFSPASEFGINFFVVGHNVTFGAREFCLITGLAFGEQTPEITIRGKSFNDRNHHDSLNDLDVVRICLLLLVEHGFKGREGTNFVDKTMLCLVNDMGAWNAFPWGSYLWSNTYPHIHDALQKNARQNRKAMLNYTLKGFTWAFKTNDFKDLFTPVGGINITISATVLSNHIPSFVIVCRLFHEHIS